jgi:exonuclease V gamma subunit
MWTETFFGLSPQIDAFEMEVSGPIPFAFIENLLHKLFSQKSASVNASHLQAVKFVSLEQGALFPAKVIILMGMDEGAFPRVEPPTALEELPLTPSSHEDRYLFLEAVCHAREKLLITYSSIHPEDGKQQRPSLLVQELIKYAGIEVQHHPALPSVVSHPCVPDPLEPISKTTWEVASLSSLARHPLTFFLEKRLGLYFEREQQGGEFTLSKKDLWKLKAKAHEPVETLVEELEAKGKLPLGPFKRVAAKEIEEEMKSYLSSLKKLQVRSEEVYSIELKEGFVHKVQLSENRWIYPPLHVGDKVILGKIDNLSSEGLLYHGEELVRIWPQYLVALKIFPDLPLLLTKKGKIFTTAPSDALERYLAYAAKALCSPSPLLPSWERAILHGGKIPQEVDKTVLWAQQRAIVPEIERWIFDWQPYLQEVFHELL